MTETTTKPETNVTYSDPEVGGIIVTLQTLYALDDAIANQINLRRPETFIKPLEGLRQDFSAELTRLTAKSNSAEKPAETK